MNMKWFADLKIASKVYLGFGLLVFLLILMGGVGVRGLQQSGDHISTYRSYARNTNAAAHIDANLLSARLGVKDFVISGSDQAIQTVEERAAKTQALISEARKLDMPEEQTAQLEEVDRELKDYAATFKEVS